MDSALRVLDVLILVGSTVYTVTALCAVGAMWALEEAVFHRDKARNVSTEIFIYVSCFARGGPSSG